MRYAIYPQAKVAADLQSRVAMSRPPRMAHVICDSIHTVPRTSVWLDVHFDQMPVCKRDNARVADELQWKVWCFVVHVVVVCCCRRLSAICRQMSFEFRMRTFLTSDPRTCVTRGRVTRSGNEASGASSGVSVSVEESVYQLKLSVCMACIIVHRVAALCTFAHHTQGWILPSALRQLCASARSIDRSQAWHESPDNAPSQKLSPLDRRVGDHDSNEHTADVGAGCGKLTMRTDPETLRFNYNGTQSHGQSYPQQSDSASEVITQVVEQVRWFRRSSGGESPTNELWEIHRARDRGGASRASRASARAPRASGAR